MMYTRENDRVISINNVRPKSVEEAVGTIKEAGKHLEVLIERRGEKPARREQQGQPGSAGGRNTRLEPPQHFTFNTVQQQQQQYSRHSESYSRKYVNTLSVRFTSHLSPPISARLMSDNLGRGLKVSPPGERWSLQAQVNEIFKYFCNISEIF